MSQVVLCPTCGGKSKVKEYKEISGVTYTAIQDFEAFERIAQLKSALTKSSNKVKALQEEIKALKVGSYGS